MVLEDGINRFPNTPQLKGKSRRVSLATPMRSQSQEDLTVTNLNNDVAVRNAVNGLELLIRVLSEELERIRFRLREKGNQMRLFFGSHFRIDYGRLGRILTSLLGRMPLANDARSLQFEGDAAMIFNEVPIQVDSDRRLPKFTMNDLAEVLLSDDFEEGVIRAYAIRSPKWDRLPERVLPNPATMDGMSEFQLFNKPLTMTMTQDDEDERLSLTSAHTHTTFADGDKLKSVEAQLAMLSRQMALLLNAKSHMTSTSPLPLPMSVSPDPDFSPVVSEDEGKGASLYSPSASHKRFSMSGSISSMGSSSLSAAVASTSMTSFLAAPAELPRVSPPAGPPPPPPPSFLLNGAASVASAGGVPPAPPPPPADLFSHTHTHTSTDPIQRKDSCESQASESSRDDENRSPDSSASVQPGAAGESSKKSSIVRPSVFDLRTVQLRKVDAKSPGGTPRQRSRRSNQGPADQGNFLAAALREKFRTANNSFSEHEDDASTTWDCDD